MYFEPKETPKLKNEPNRYVPRAGSAHCPQEYRLGETARRTVVMAQGKLSPKAESHAPTPDSDPVPSALKGTLESLRQITLIYGEVTETQRGKGHFHST